MRETLARDATVRIISSTSKAFAEDGRVHRDPKTRLMNFAFIAQLGLLDSSRGARSAVGLSTSRVKTTRTLGHAMVDRIIERVSRISRADPSDDLIAQEALDPRVDSGAASRFGGDELLS